MRLVRFAFLRLLFGGVFSSSALGIADPDAFGLEMTSNRPETSVFSYVGQFSATRLNQIVRFDTEFQPSWVAVAGVTRELFPLGPAARMEGEFQLARHWGRQHHFEVNALVSARWMRFPWDRVVDTSFAVGSGLSYAFRRPALEVKPDRGPDHFLKYMLVEIDGALPRHPDWSLFARIHHRSGIFGVLSDARGSNFVGLGLRRRI